MNIVCSGCNFSSPYTHFSRSVGYYNVRAFDAGMNGHIAKPIDIEKLGAVILSVLNKQEN